MKGWPGSCGSNMRVRSILCSTARNYCDVAPETILAPGGKPNHCWEVVICLPREFSGLRWRDLGRCFGGIGGPAVTIRCRAILRHPAQDQAEKIEKPIQAEGQTGGVNGADARYLSKAGAFAESLSTTLARREQ